MIDTLKSNIKRLLSDHNLSAHALERRAGLKPSAIQNILHGRSKRPGIDVIYAIAQELNCSVDDLMERPIEAISPKVELAPPVWNIQALETIIPILLLELKKHQKTVEKNTLLILLNEVYSYAEKTDTQNVSHSFIAWLTERVLTAQKEKSQSVF